MNIGLLKADYVNSDLLPIAGDLPDIFQQFLSKAEKLSMEVFDVTQNNFPPSNYVPDAFFISGSRNSVLDNFDWIKHLKHFALERIQRKEKIVGICFGHQILATALGGKVGRSPLGWNVGVSPLTIRNAPWNNGKKVQLNLLFNHRDVVQKPPLDALVLGGDHNYPVQMFNYKNYALGLQAHPEYPNSYQEALMQVAPEMPLEVQENAVQRNHSFIRDDDIMLQWIISFINSK